MSVITQKRQYLHTQSKVGVKQSQSSLQAVNLDSHPLVSQKVWTGNLSGFPVNTQSFIDQIEAANNLIGVFKLGATATNFYSNDASAGKVYTNQNYPNVRLFEDVLMSPVEGSDVSNGFVSYQIISGLANPSPTAAVQVTDNLIRIQDFIQPVAVFNNGKPVLGYTVKPTYCNAQAGTYQPLRNLSNWATTNDNWQFIYAAGLLKFDQNNYPGNVNKKFIKFTGFQYIGPCLDQTLANLPKSTVSGNTTIINNNMVVSGGMTTNGDFIVNSDPSRPNFVNTSGYCYNFMRIISANIDGTNSGFIDYDLQGSINIAADYIYAIDLYLCNPSTYLSSTYETFQNVTGNINQHIISDFNIDYNVGDILNVNNSTYYINAGTIIQKQNNRIRLGNLGSLFKSDLSELLWVGQRKLILDDSSIISAAFYGFYDSREKTTTNKTGIDYPEKYKYCIFSIDGQTSGNTQIYSHCMAFGVECKAIGEAAVTFNLQNYAIGIYSFAANRSNKAEAAYSTAFGISNVTMGDQSFVHGNKNYAIGKNSHAEGTSTSAYGWGHHSEGYNTQTFNWLSGNNSSYAKNIDMGQHVEGHYNTPVSGRALVIGNGNHKSGNYAPTMSEEEVKAKLFPKSNLLNKSLISTGIDISGNTKYTIYGNIYELDWEGNGQYAGIVSAAGFYDTKLSTVISGGSVGDNYLSVNNPSGTGTLTIDNIKILSNKLAIGPSSYAGSYCLANGFATSAFINSSHAEGNKTSAYGAKSHAEGNQTIACGKDSHTEGYITKVLGTDHNNDSWASHAEGYKTIVSGDYSHAEGNATIASGTGVHVEGYTTKAYGIYSHAEGNTTIVSGNAAHAEGYQTCALYDYQHVAGKWNQVLDAAYIIGGGEANKNRKNIFTVDWNGNTYTSSLMSASNFYDTTNNSLISDIYGKVKTVNNISPDTNGNVTLSTFTNISASVISATAFIHDNQIYTPSFQNTYITLSDIHHDIFATDLSSTTDTAYSIIISNNNLLNGNSKMLKLSISNIDKTISFAGKEYTLQTENTYLMVFTNLGGTVYLVGQPTVLSMQQ